MPHVRTDYRIGLASTLATSAPIPVPPGMTRATVQVIASTFGVAQVEVRRSIDPDQTWVSYQSEVLLTTNDTIRQEINVSGLGWIQLRTRTGDPTADASARVIVNFY